jgi:hypothetical protein
MLARVEALLGLRSAEDDGADLAVALEIGGDIDPARKRRFLAAVEEGAAWWSATACCCANCGAGCPARLQGLGEALGNRPAIRRRIASADFYVIEARAYHADHARLVAHYDGCARKAAAP